MRKRDRYLAAVLMVMPATAYPNIANTIGAMI
jgi:hypothetical protein